MELRYKVEEFCKEGNVGDIGWSELKMLIPLPFVGFNKGLL